MKKIAPVMLIILDGWGCGQENNHNAVHLADTPNMDKWQAEYPYTTLAAHNGMVGLPEGQMGNSEVGHLNIGAGRIVYQDFTRINKAIESGDLKQNEVLNSIIDKTITKGSSLHLLGLLSDGGVHSHINHLLAIIKIAKEKGLQKVFIHCFMDGRDTPPKSGKGYMQQLKDTLNKIGVGRVATVSGRYFCMDRDNRWDRVHKGWKSLVEGKGIKANDPVSAVQNAYDNGETDEFIKPVNIYENGMPIGLVENDDSVLFFNFRADRARQLSHAFVDEEFDKFDRKTRPDLVEFATCTRYEKDFTMPVLFPPLELTRILGEEVCRHGLKQLRIAETEKYAHVTYFFNGGREAVFENEDRILIESPREVATYDKKPEMSAFEVTDALTKRLTEKEYDLVVLNFANGDMVGHSGVLPAAIKACEAVDNCLGKLVSLYHQKGGVVIITADHGNADIMYDLENDSPHTAHTLSPVPFMLLGNNHKDCGLRDGGALKDIAPTILSLMHLPVPEEMEGENLII